MEPPVGTAQDRIAASRRQPGRRQPGQRRTGRGWRLGGHGRRQRAGLITAAVVLAAAATVVAVRLLSAGGAACQLSLVPAYFAPASGWDQAVSSARPPAVMILDISGSGAGDAPEPGFQAAVSRARAAGVTVLGYIGTSYGRQRVAAVQADVRDYRSWYGVTDVFLDQAASGAAGLGYYQNLAGYLHRVNPGAKIWLNPGVYPDKRYMSFASVIMVYEGSYENYRNIRVPAWAGQYPASRFAHTIYATPASQLTAALTLSRSRHAGYVYITDGSGSNPYGALPAYWAAEDAALSARC